jgi:Methyltransferase domain
MNMDCFLKRYTDVLMNDRDDDLFKNISLLAGGTTSCRISKLLNFAVSQIDSTECYVEVGVLTGTTLCSAGYVNDKVCIGIDNYLPEHMREITGMDRDAVISRCQHNINCLSSGKTKMIYKSFRDVSKSEIPLPIAVSFIDGKHDFPSVIENFSWLEPMLADNAIIVLDDINYIEVSMAIEAWMGQKSANYDLLAYIKPFYGEDHKNISSVRDRFMNNGVCVIRYHRDTNSNTFSYDPNKLGWTQEEIMTGKKA